ncbi:MAG: DUF4412 domain-containing protein [Gemmatimonadaceae bacterium]|nr:DUF4412 domain-containing protein [Gemmatimonadaceae bacterium]
MRRFLEWRRLAAVASLAGALVAGPSEAQETAGLTFDVTVNTGDSAAGSHQTGRGWIAGKRTRIDLRGGMPGTAMPGMDGDNISIIVHDSSDAPTVALVMHDTKKFMYPSRMMEQLKEMMEAMPEKPAMTFSVTNIVVDTLGAGETISGFATKRYKVSADIAMSIEMMSEHVSESMHVESEGDFAEELSDYSDPLRDTRGFKSAMSGMPWADSASTAEMEKLIRAAPRGLALRQVDRVTGVSEGGEPVQTTTTRFSNIKRESVPLSMFAIPEGYTEMEMPMVGGPDVN